MKMSKHFWIRLILFVFWFILGLSILIVGDITPLSYFCIWALLIFEYAGDLVDTYFNEINK